MTLRHDNPQPKRPPMKTSTMWIFIGCASAVLIFVFIVIGVNGIAFF